MKSIVLSRLAHDRGVRVVFIMHTDPPGPLALPARGLWVNGPHHHGLRRQSQNMGQAGRAGVLDIF